jgi:hypothetical protein
VRVPVVRPVVERCFATGVVTAVDLVSLRLPALSVKDDITLQPTAQTANKAERC